MSLNVASQLVTTSTLEPPSMVMFPEPKRELLFTVFMFVPEINVACLASRESLISFSEATFESDGVDPKLVAIALVSILLSLRTLPCFADNALVELVLVKLSTIVTLASLPLMLTLVLQSTVVVFTAETI